MDRRKFIKTSGLSLASVLVAKTFYGSSKTDRADVMNIPDKITAEANQQIIQLNQVKDAVWENNGIRVHLKNSKKALAVFVEAPDVELTNVVLHWNVPVGSGLVLNDSWERTYGDVSWHGIKESEVFPWYFMEYNQDRLSGFGVKTGSGSFCSWQFGNGRLSLALDTHSGGKGVLLGDRKLKAAEIVTYRGKQGESPFLEARQFMKVMSTKPRLPKHPVYGINDWYYCYGKNTHESILDHTRVTSGLSDNPANLPFSVIDDGWFEGRDVSQPNKKFPDMPGLADEIRKLGMRPGIWTRPLISDDGRFNSSRLLQRENNDGVIDPSIPENIELIKSYFKLYKNWGYEMIKVDFSTFDIFGKWGFQMLEGNPMTIPGWSMYNRSLTNAEIITNFYEAIRQSSGDMYVIGCNTLSHLSAGFFELNRTGDDTSGLEWGRVSRLGVNTLAFRGIQHDIFYASDADCVGLTKEIPWEKNKQWMELLAKSGTPLFISAQPEVVGKEQKEFIRKCFSIASRQQPLGEPLDWMKNQNPTKWKFGEEIVQYDWS